MVEEVSLEEYKKAYRELRLEEERKGFFIHLVAYILINLMFIVTNLIYSPKAIWFIYPLFGWGIGIASHYLGGVRWAENELKKKEAGAEYRAREAKRK